jgi:hypothetical protein
MITPDPLLKEIWEVKDALAARDNYNADTLFQRLRQLQQSSGRHYVDFKPQPAGAELRSVAPDEDLILRDTPSTG